MSINRTPLGRLVWKLLAAILAATAIAIVLYLIGVFVHVNLVLLAAVVVGILWWTATEVRPELSELEWPTTSLDLSGPRLTAERRARRLSTMASNAQPARHFTGQSLGDVLVRLVATRLVRSHGAVPADPFRDADGIVSPALLDYLRQSAAGHAPAVKRATLDAYLKEIEAL